MKICTDFEQSKTLDEILPLDSADMYWLHANKEYCCEVSDGPLERIEGDIPAWSLDALMYTLPSGKALIHDKEGRGYKCICNNIDTCFYENPVDACVEMILKLYKLNLLK
jgi:hypothetical protein